MPRYFLENPAEKGSILKQYGQSGDKPLYRCNKSSTFWLLRYNANFQRELVQYDPNKGVTIPNQLIPVPEDWLGEPHSIAIDEQTLFYLKTESILDYKKEIKKIIEDGDFVVLLDENQNIKGQITIDKDDNIVIKQNGRN